MVCLPFATRARLTLPRPKEDGEGEQRQTKDVRDGCGHTRHSGVAVNTNTFNTAPFLQQFGNELATDVDQHQQLIHTLNEHDLRPEHKGLEHAANQQRTQSMRAHHQPH